ncbi:MAG: exodeoxyribonuclease V subunit gamma [Clostridia bacterium]|nr:exodeoxyribonuclease V subunit gamma [Clostridia bacterium]
MRRLLLGRSGSGKTQAVFDRLEALVAQGHEKVFLLVPEQYSFENERDLQMRLGTQAASRVQLISFTRLADKVFRELGGMAGEQLDDGMRALLMSRALEQVSLLAQDAGEPLMGADPRQVTDCAYVEELLILWREFRQCAVPIDELERVWQEMEQDGTLAGHSLQEKAKDFHRIFTAYTGLAENTALDDADKLTRLVALLPQSAMPQGAAVLVDGFKGFTAQELAILEQLLTRVDELVVTLGTDTPGKRWSTALDHSREQTLFEPVTKTVEHLREIAQRHGLSWDMQLLQEDHRHTDGALRALEAGFYAPSPTVYEGRADSVTVTPCRDVYEECDYVARRIRRLLREENYRCRDITIVARDLSAYSGLLEDALDQEGVPYSMDARRDLLDEPLIVYIRAALRIAVGGLQTQEILRLLKTDLGRLSPIEVARLENYVYMWRIDGAAWQQEWTENPGGLGVPVTASTARELAQLNAWRQAIVEPLMRLREALRSGANGYQFALAVYRYLTDDVDMAQRIAQQVDTLESLGEPIIARRAARLWDEVIALLDRFEAALGNQRMAAARLEELFSMLAQMIDVGQIPQGLDAVTVGSADRIRYHKPRAVFVLGANEGVFPAYPENTTLFTEEERETLAQHGLELTDDLLVRCIEERYFAYMAVAAPSDRLFVTYHTEGEAVPSPLVAMVRTILPQHCRGTAVAANGDDLESAEAMFARLAQNYTRSTPVTESLREALAGEATVSGRLAAVGRGAGRAAFRLEDAQVAQALFGTDMRLSASQADKFHECRFQYFCRYGLYLQPRRVAQVDAASFGVIVHYVMETLLPLYVKKDGLLDRVKAQDAAREGMTSDRQAQAENELQAQLLATIAEDVHNAVMTYAEEEMGGTQNKSGRFLYQLQLAERSACNMLWHTVMELRQSAFVPVRFELGICPGDEGETSDEEIPSLCVSFSRGRVRLRGKVDRLDLFVRFDGKAFVRVVDYKTNSKKFNLDSLGAGLNMQMLLYLYTICEHPERIKSGTGELLPAGVLYHPLSDLLVDRGESDEKIQTARLSSMRMDGVVLDDASVVQAMERDGNKVFIPAKIGKDGKASGSVLSAEQFILLRGVVEQLLANMANSLLDGDIAALPIVDGDRLHCTYCDYRAVCGRDEDDAVRLLSDYSIQQALEDLQNAADEEVSDGE